MLYIKTLLNLLVKFDGDFSESFVFTLYKTHTWIVHSPHPQAGFYRKLFVFISKKIITKLYCPTESMS